MYAIAEGHELPLLQSSQFFACIYLTRPCAIGKWCDGYLLLLSSSLLLLLPFMIIRMWRCCVGPIRRIDWTVQLGTITTNDESYHHQHAKHRVLCDNNMNYEYACTALSRKVIPITRHYLIKLSFFFFRGFIDIAQISRNHCTRRRKNRFRKKKKRIVDEVAFVSFTKNAESNSHQLHFINLKNSFKLIRRFDENEPMKILLKSD